jgi:NAD(P)-dependent dehydrogenase (short-subunit alcohol dehydrogenase family)
MSEKKYVVIGANAGIGLETTKLLSAQGSSVLALSRKGETVSQIDGVKFFQYDASQENSTIDAIPEVLDGLVYCPGTITLKPFTRFTDADFIYDLNINLLGAIRSIRLFLPSLKKSSQASIVLFSTVAAQTGMPYHTSIAAAKGAVEGFARSLAAELAPKVRVNVIAPSLTRTALAATLLSTPEKEAAGAKRHPLGRVGEAKDCAEMVAFLLSEKSSWVTGQIFHVDGGMSSIKLM